MEWPPTDNAEVLSVVWPEPFSVPVPRVVEPSMNVTVPVGTPEPGALAATVAVNVTDWPKTEGLADDDTELLVPSWFTVCVNADDVLVVKSVSPP